MHGNAPSQAILQRPANNRLEGKELYESERDWWTPPTKLGVPKHPSSHQRSEGGTRGDRDPERLGRRGDNEDRRGFRREPAEISADTARHAGPLRAAQMRR